MPSNPLRSVRERFFLLTSPFIDPRPLFRVIAGIGITVLLDYYLTIPQ